MEEDFLPGDNVTFTVGEGPRAYTGYGRISTALNGSAMLVPDKPIAPGVKISNVEKVNG